MNVRIPSQIAIVQQSPPFLVLFTDVYDVFFSLTPAPFTQFQYLRLLSFYAPPCLPALKNHFLVVLISRGSSSQVPFPMYSCTNGSGSLDPSSLSSRERADGLRLMTHPFFTSFAAIEVRSS